MNQYIPIEMKAVIVGFYRCGVPVKKISEITKLWDEIVYDIIGNYFLTGSHE